MSSNVSDAERRAAPLAFVQRVLRQCLSFCVLPIAIRVCGRGWDRARARLTGVVLLLGLPMLACQPDAAPAGYHDVFRGNRLDTTALRRYPYDQQIDIYLYGTSHTRPVDSRFMLAVARNGRAVVPAVLQRLRREPDDFAKTDLIRLLQEVDYCCGDLAHDSATIESVTEAIPTIRDSTRRLAAERALERIVSGREKTIP